MRAAAALASAFLLFKAGGCGSGEMGAAEGEPATEPTATAPAAEEDGENWAPVMWSLSEGQDQPPTGPPTASKLAVFQEPEQPSDSFASSGSEDDWVAEGTSERFRPGHELFARARLLVPAAYAEGFRLFGVPTEKGWVCLHRVDPRDREGSGSGMCSRGLDDGIEYAMSGSQSLWAVYGLIADDVRAVKVVADGQPWPAVMGRSGFVFEAHPAKICPLEIESLILERVKGQSDEVEVLAPGPDETDQQDEAASSFGCR